MRLFKVSVLKKAGSYLIELLIVVVGVSIAFQLNVWNDSRKENNVERQLLENFASENRYNLLESDSSSIEKKNSVNHGIAFINLLRQEDASSDSVKWYLAQLYEITWTGFTTTHLKNYLNYTTGSSALREEMLNLDNLCGNIYELGEKYVDQKQTKFINYLSDAVDLNENLNIIDKEKLFSVQFKNNLVFIIAYERSMADILDEIRTSQSSLDSLLILKDY